MIFLIVSTWIRVFMAWTQTNLFKPQYSAFPKICRNSAQANRLRSTLIPAEQNYYYSIIHMIFFGRSTGTNVRLDAFLKIFWYESLLHFLLSSLIGTRN